MNIDVISKNIRIKNSSIYKASGKASTYIDNYLKEPLKNFKLFHIYDISNEYFCFETRMFIGYTKNKKYTKLHFFVCYDILDKNFTTESNITLKSKDDGNWYVIPGYCYSHDLFKNKFKEREDVIYEY